MKIIIAVAILLMCAGSAFAEITIIDTPQGRAKCVQVGNYIKCS